jgi:hypothetical protein
VWSLPTNPARARRKKFRGKRRHFAGVRRKAEAFELDARREPWWNYWHYHADWLGRGNRRWKYRLEHLRALATVYGKIADARLETETPFQLWLLLDVDDAGQDATFLHSPNPYGTTFPFRPEGVVWTSDAPRLVALGQALAGRRLRFGHLTCADSDEPTRRLSSWLIYSPDVGVPLEGA